MNELIPSSKEISGTIEDLWGCIPEDVRELLFFTFEELPEEVDSIIVKMTFGLTEDRKSKLKTENINTYVEPSLIYFSLPIEKVDDLNTIPDPRKTAKYYQLTPMQKYKYLKWLSNIEKPIGEGYFNIFLRGVERRLFDEKHDSAVKMLERLTGNINAIGGEFYNLVTTSLLSADILFNISLKNLSFVYNFRIWNNIQLYLKYYLKEPFNTDDIAKYLTYKVKNSRYTDSPEYKMILSDILTERTGKPYIEIGDFVNENSIDEKALLVGFKNETLCWKLRGQYTSMPKLDGLLNFLGEIHEECHKRTKLRLRKLRKIRRSQV